MDQALSVVASSQNGTYPRPQMLRPVWKDLGGVWEFDYDDENVGLRDGWPTGGHAFARQIVVPFPPESSASSIGDRGFHPVVWYRKLLTADDLAATGHRDGDTLLLHFGAVDYRAHVWVDGLLVGTHEGGHTPFHVEIAQPRPGIAVVVRAEDDPHDLTQPRGKQDWELEPHVVWYDRTTGIWQPVWLESVPAQHIAHLVWRTDEPSATVTLTVELAQRALTQTSVRVRLSLSGEALGSAEVDIVGTRQIVTVPIPALRNGQDRDRLRWSPERPTLIDASVELLGAEDVVIDAVASYFGVRSVGVSGSDVLLNGIPYMIRAVLEQGFWPESHLAAPTAEALRAEVELIKSLGFNTARIHQKIEDPRFLYWADRLGLMLWTELPSAYEYSDASVQRLTHEWTEVLRRDASHPSVCVWVPFNESWGVGDLATNASQRALTQALYHLTKALDSSRIVISNDGWEHTESDLFTVHDYQNDCDELAARYRDKAAADETLKGVKANGRRMLVGEADSDRMAAAPILLSEFGGVSLDMAAHSGSWGYRVVNSTEALEDQLRGLFRAVHSSSALAGWCYTQLTDTQQETNGLLDEYRQPKLPLETLRALVLGEL